MKTIKVLGSGPLAGQTFYGKFLSSNKFSPDESAPGIGTILLELDEKYNGKMEFARFSSKSGALLPYELPGVETDLLYIDKDDLKRWNS